MPWGDRTGPTGMGPMTGRGAGYCGGYGAPGYASPMFGRGFRGRGGGRGGGGRGFRNRYYATGVPGWQHWGGAGWAPPWGGPPPHAPYASGRPAAGRDQEIDFLKSEAERLQGALSDINDRLRDLAAEEESGSK